MPGLIDITPAVETVDVRGHEVIVNGLGAETIGSLFLRFPKFRQMVETNKWDAQALLQMSDEAINAIIAASCGEAFNEQTAAYLGLGEKAEILGSVFRITMPRGPGPFAGLMRACGLIESAASATGSDMTSPSPSSSSNGMGTRKRKSTHQDSSPAG